MTLCCDLCNHDEPIWVYPATSFLVVLETGTEGFRSIHESVGAWAVCAECSDTLELRGVPALVDRCATIGSMVLGIRRVVFIEHIRPIIEGFAQARTGARRLVTPPRPETSQDRSPGT